MKNRHTTITPGQYQFRPIQFLPWMNARVFIRSIAEKDKLSVRVAGVEMDADKVIKHGEWKAVKRRED